MSVVCRPANRQPLAKLAREKVVDGEDDEDDDHDDVSSLVAIRLWAI